MTKSNLRRREFISCYSSYSIIQKVKAEIQGREFEVAADAKAIEEYALLSCTSWLAQSFLYKWGPSNQRQQDPQSASHIND